MDPQAEAVDIPGLEWDGGAPMPVVVATDYRILFSCYRPFDDGSIVVAEFIECSSVRFGLPNDEVLYGHPCGQQMRGYRVFTIVGSPWLQELMAIEAVHPQAAQHALHRSRHYFLVFHDSSLEAIATDLVVRETVATMAHAVERMTELANLA